MEEKKYKCAKCDFSTNLHFRMKNHIVEKHNEKTKRILEGFHYNKVEEEEENNVAW